MKKMISWNVNGLRACLGKGFLEYVKETDMGSSFVNMAVPEYPFFSA